MAEETAAGYLDGRIDALREHLSALAAAAPRLPEAFAAVRDQLALDWQARGPAYVSGLIIGFAGLGFALEALYRYFVARSEAAERLRAIAFDFLREAGALAAFTLGSAAASRTRGTSPRCRG